MMLVMAYIAVKNLGYDECLDQKHRHQILYAVRLFVCYKEGYSKPNNNTRTLSNFIDKLNIYSSKDSNVPFPLSSDKQRKKTSKVRKIMEQSPQLLFSVYRSVVKGIGDKASFQKIAQCMTNRLRSLHSDSQITLTKMDVNWWFHSVNGKLKRESFKPRLTEEKKQQRVKWCAKVKALIEFPIEFLKIIIPLCWRICFLDEKWFYRSSGRNYRKAIPRQEWETEEDAQ